MIINEIYPSPFSIVPYSLSGVLLLACSILGIAYKFKQIRIKKDISYPVYLYHMLFVNAAIHIGYRGNWLAALMVIILTFILAYLSTLFVEKYINQIKLKLF